MRIFLWLVAVLGAGPCSAEKLVTGWKLNDGLPDGSIITLYFWHESTPYDEFAPVRINFYTSNDDVMLDNLHDIPAQLRVGRSCDFPIVTTSYLNGKWKKEMKEKQYQGITAITKGWWRVDVYKPSHNTLDVFLNGFSSGLRTFAKSLDYVTQIFIRSDFIDSTQKVQMYQYSPNSAVMPIPTLNYDAQIACQNAKYGNAKCGHLVDKTITEFAVGTRLEMIVMLRADGDAKHALTLVPAIVFSPTDGPEFIFKIYQKYDDGHVPSIRSFCTNHGRVETYFASPGNESLCMHAYPNETPNGELQHIHLERTSVNTVKMSVLYTPTGSSVWTNTPMGGGTVTCEHTFKENNAHRLNSAFSIWNHDGAMILHFEKINNPQERHRQDILDIA